eukprot:8070054-Karenia_brevis.AAC.1
MFKVLHVDGKSYPIIPDEASLKVLMSEPARKRLAELKKEWPGPPPAKRARVVVEGSSPNDILASVPSLWKLLENFTIRKQCLHSIGGAEFSVLWVERKTSPAVTMHYLHNKSTQRLL